MSIQSEIDRLHGAKNTIAAALQTMGEAPPAGTTLDQYADRMAALVDNINDLLDAINGEVV